MKRLGLLLAVLFGIGILLSCDKQETTHSYDYKIPSGEDVFHQGKIHHDKRT